MKTLLLFLALYVSVLFGMDFQPFQLYSGFISIAANTYICHHIDLGCLSGFDGTLIISIDNPNFLSSDTGVYAFCSNGPAEGQYSPWPDPQDNTTYQYTTKNGFDNPLSNITIPQAGGIDLYCTLDSSNGLLGSYSLATEFYPSSEKALVTNEYHQTDVPIVRQSSQVGQYNIIQLPLYVGNKGELTVSIPYNKWHQNQLPMCQSALAASYGKNTKLCLHFTVVGQDPSFISYQFVSIYPNPSQNTPKWKTRDPNNNDVEDYSGRSKLFINEWISLPVLSEDIPSTLYHTIYADGGSGNTPPYINDFTVYYEINDVCP